jgi:hypothetical protein
MCMLTWGVRHAHAQISTGPACILLKIKRLGEGEREIYISVLVGVVESLSRFLMSQTLILSFKLLAKNYTSLIMPTILCHRFLLLLFVNKNKKYQTNPLREEPLWRLTEGNGLRGPQTIVRKKQVCCGEVTKLWAKNTVIVPLYRWNYGIELNR